MHRLIVVILSAVDAAIAAAVGIAATLAPLTLLWVLGMGGTADWGLLWPTSATDSASPVTVIGRRKRHTIRGATASTLALARVAETSRLSAHAINASSGT